MTFVLLSDEKLSNPWKNNVPLPWREGIKGREG
jgi:hypothetical protein